jgi:hypothetical protein
MVDVCYADEIGEEYDEKKGVYITKLLIRKSCCVTFQKIIGFWFLNTGIHFSVEGVGADSTFKIFTLKISLECANKIFEIQKCVEFGADRVQYPYVEYSDYINRVFKAADKRISYEN